MLNDQNKRSENNGLKEGKGGEEREAKVTGDPVGLLEKGGEEREAKVTGDPVGLLEKGGEEREAKVTGDPVGLREKGGEEREAKVTGDPVGLLNSGSYLAKQVGHKCEMINSTEIKSVPLK